MFDTRPLFHEYPEVEGFSAYDCDIVSSEMPSGASWLANCLLELDVALWKPWGADLREDWQSLGERRFRYQRDDEAWRRLLPGLLHGRTFAFRAAPLPRLSHAWPGTYASPRKTILFVRDPRDALYSLWHRARRVALVDEAQPFAEFLAQPWFHYPLSRADYLYWWLQVWRQALDRREHLILRYEDYRADALATLQRAVTFLGMTVEPAALAAAAARSDFRVARAAEQALIGAGTLNAQFNRAGCAEEWRDAFDAAMHAAVGPRFAPLYRWLGYAADRSGLAYTPPTLAADTREQVLVAAQADQWPSARADQLRRWLIAASMSADGV